MLKVRRLDISPYQAPDFAVRERAALESLSEIEYGDFENPNVVITNTHTDVTRYSPQFWSDVKLLIHPNSGYDNLPESFVRKFPFPVVVGNPIRAKAVAEYVLARLFEHYAAIDHQPRWVPGRQWPRRLLSDARVLIIGHGHIGKIVAAALKPLVEDLHVIDGDKSLGPLPALSDINVLIPLASLTPSSHHIVNKELLDRCAEDFVLINAARGKLVDQHALKEALAKRPRAFAYLDVFEREPFDDAEFIEFDNVKTTCHIAGVHARLDQGIIDFVVRTLKQFREGKLPNELIL